MWIHWFIVLDVGGKGVKTNAHFQAPTMCQACYHISSKFYEVSIIIPILWIQTTTPRLNKWPTDNPSTKADSNPSLSGRYSKVIISTLCHHFFMALDREHLYNPSTVHIFIKGRKCPWRPATLNSLITTSYKLTIHATFKAHWKAFLCVKENLRCHLTHTKQKQIAPFIIITSYRVAIKRKPNT